MKTSTITRSFASPLVKVEYNQVQLQKIVPDIKRNIQAGINIFMNNNIKDGRNKDVFSFVVSADSENNLEIKMKKSLFQRILSAIPIKKAQAEPKEVIQKEEFEHGLSGYIGFALNRLKFRNEKPQKTSI